MAGGATKRGKRAGWNPRVGRSSRSDVRWSAMSWSSGPVPRDFSSRDTVRAPNYGFHGQAMIVLRALNLEHAAGNPTLLAALQRVKGTRLPASKINRQDNSLQAWSWIDGTFSWVEPTAWCLLAQKQWSAVSGAVVDRSPNRRRRANAGRQMLRKGRLELRQCEHARTGPEALRTNDCAGAAVAAESRVAARGGA